MSQQELPSNASETPESQPQKSKWRKRLEKMGIGAFLFFFIKGLVWIAIFLGAAKFLGCEGEEHVDPEPTEIVEPVQ